MALAMSGRHVRCPNSKSQRPSELTRRRALGLAASVAFAATALRQFFTRPGLEPGDDHGSGGHGADDPFGDDHGGLFGDTDDTDDADSGDSWDG